MEKLDELRDNSVSWVNSDHGRSPWHLARPWEEPVAWGYKTKGVAHGIPLKTMEGVLGKPPPVQPRSIEYGYYMSKFMKEIVEEAIEVLVKDNVRRYNTTFTTLI
uniref:Uncharacterized protein n=1 Tax=Lactuca sativa TaxID=4236 RepID=A0A9R1X556_LACSA|nr:hypothetical protein LSAT_V11C700366720 [Lactuca sativa]